MYSVIRVVAFIEPGAKSITRIAIAAVLCHKVCIQNVGLLLGQRQTRWINIVETLVNRPVVAVNAGVGV